MTNSEIKLVVKALCYALGDSDRHYAVKVDDSGIEVEYVASELVDSEIDPQIAKESEFEMGHFSLPLIGVLTELVAAIQLEIEEVESVGIEYKRM